jgi:hypothetical protein
VRVPDQTSRVPQPQTWALRSLGVEALDLEDHKIGQDIGNTALYMHDSAPVGGRGQLAN